MEGPMIDTVLRIGTPLSLIAFVALLVFRWLKARDVKAMDSFLAELREIPLEDRANYLRDHEDRVPRRLAKLDSAHRLAALRDDNRLERDLASERTRLHLALVGMVIAGALAAILGWKWLELRGGVIPRPPQPQVEATDDEGRLNLVVQFDKVEGMPTRARLQIQIARDPEFTIIAVEKRLGPDPRSPVSIETAYSDFTSSSTGYARIVAVDPDGEIAASSTTARFSIPARK
jgi:hypothetical protein